MIQLLISLTLIFSQLSLLAFGGGNTVLPEMQRQVVDIHHWMSAADFSAMFALAQAAPGPNLMIVPLIGWHLGGWAGLAVSSIAKFGPSSLLTGLVLKAWNRFKDKPWRRLVQAGLLPITTGLVAASAALITIASDHNAVLIVITIGCAAAGIFTRLHPLWVLGLGAVIGFICLGM